MTKRPRDPNQLAKLVVGIATGETEDATSESKKHPENVKGRAGGLKGGRTRAERLSVAERSEIARRAARSRWKKR